MMEFFTVGQLIEAIEGGKKVGVSIRGEIGNNLKEGTREEVIKHWDQPNPYEARYGEEWERVLKGCSAMSTTVCITELVEHIVTECKKFYADSNGRQLLNKTLELLTFMRSVPLLIAILSKTVATVRKSLFHTNFVYIGYGGFVKVMFQLRQVTANGQYMYADSTLYPSYGEGTIVISK